MAANYFMHQPGPDIFMLFYIKRRIEQDGQMEWYEAPYCAEEDPPSEWLLIEEAALLFEQENRQDMEECMISRLESIGKLNFGSFKKASSSKGFCYAQAYGVVDCTPLHGFDLETP